jgi:hypothetical protein
MGFATRVDVPLRALVPVTSTKPRRSQHESFTDLDVLGVAFSPAGSIQKVIADCKTSARGSTERMFWIRGVGDLFTADAAWMVRSGGVTAASRQLSARLGISVVEPDDLDALETYYPTQLRLDQGDLSFLFEPAQIKNYMSAFTTLDRKLNPLVEYRQFDYWVYEEHRNLQQVVAHLAQVARHLDPKVPAHRALFYDCAWLYVLSVAFASSYVRAVNVSEVDAALREYLFGGQLGLREKQELAEMLRVLAPPGVAEKGDTPLLPPWYAQLKDLVIRHLRRPGSINDELRYAEWVAEAQVAKNDRPVAAVFEATFQPISAKLLLDVCEFLVKSARLSSDFRTHAQRVLAQPTAPSSDKTSHEVTVRKGDPSPPAKPALMQGRLEES